MNRPTLAYLAYKLSHLAEHPGVCKGSRGSVRKRADPVGRALSERKEAGHGYVAAESPTLDLPSLNSKLSFQVREGGHGFVVALRLSSAPLSVDTSGNEVSDCTLQQLHFKPQPLSPATSSHLWKTWGPNFASLLALNHLLRCAQVYCGLHDSSITACDLRTGGEVSQFKVRNPGERTLQTRRRIEKTEMPSNPHHQH